MPTRAIPSELQAHEAEVLARVKEALVRQAGVPNHLMSDPDANIERYARTVVDAAEPLISALTLRAFAVGMRKTLADGHMPEAVQVGVELALASAERTAEWLEKNWHNE